MKIKTLVVKTAAVSLGILLAAPLNGEQVAITDSKIRPINMGLDNVEHFLGKMKVGDQSLAKRLTNDIDKLRVRFNRIPENPSVAVQHQYVLQRFESLSTAVAEKGGVMAITKPAPDTQAKPVLPQGTMKPGPNAVVIDPKEPQVSAEAPRDLGGVELYLRRIESDLASLGKGEPIDDVRREYESLLPRYQRMPRSSHPDYVNVVKRMGVLAAAIQARTPDTGMSAEETTQFLSRIQADYGNGGKLEVPSSGDIFDNSNTATVEGVEQFANTIQAIRHQREVDLPLLQKVHLATGEGKTWLSFLETRVEEQIVTEIDRAKQRLESAIGQGLTEAKHRAGRDPGKEAWAFGGDAAKRSIALYDRSLANAEAAIALEKALEIDAGFAARKQELEAAHATWLEKGGEVAKLAQLPEDIGNRKLRGIAEEVLEKDKYEVEGWEKLVVNAKQRNQERIEHKVFNRTLETIVRNWDEFQVTTVEKNPEDGKLYLWSNTIAYFHKAPNPTPVKEWILAKRVRGSEISPDNL